MGILNPVTNEIEIHDQIESGDEPLLDLAAVHTYMKGGTVYAVEPEMVPGGPLPPLCSAIDQMSLLSLTTASFVTTKHQPSAPSG